MRLRACRSCDSAELTSVLSLGDLPLANAFIEPEAQGIADDRFPLELVFCRSCALVQLDETVSPDKLFTEYPYFSSQSQTFVNHAGDLVERVLEDYDLDDG